jgi:hypothetical protein
MLCSIPKQNYPGAFLTNGMVSYRQHSSWTGEKSGLVLVVNFSCCHGCKCLVPQVTPWCLRVMSLLWRTTPRKPTPLSFFFSSTKQQTQLDTLLSPQVKFIGLSVGVSPALQWVWT